MRLRVPRFLRSASGAIGLTLLLLIVLTALIGPLLAPNDPIAPLAAPGQPPGPGLPLGADQLGRDVLSRLLHGGLSVLWIASAATLLSYLAAATVGLIAGYTRSIVDPLLMRAVDVLLAFPALLILLLLVGGLGPKVEVLIIGIVFVQLPAIARVIRTTTLEASTRGYVEAAVARGERMPAVLVREVLPNILPIVLADFGIRFGASIILVASVNYLGLGLAPPASDWGLMTSENRSYISINIWSVLAPAIMLALLTISVNLVADAYVRSLSRSTVLRPKNTDAEDDPREITAVGA